MKKILIAMSALVMLALFWHTAAPQDPPATCSVDPPPLRKYTEFDPNPARYALPESQAETDEYHLDETGATLTYTDQGTGEGHKCPGSDSYYFTESQYVNHGMPECWVFEQVKISECPR